MTSVAHLRPNKTTVHLPDTDGVHLLPRDLPGRGWAAVAVCGEQRFFIDSEFREAFRGQHYETTDGTSLVLGRPSHLNTPLPVRGSTFTRNLSLPESPISHLERHDGPNVDISSELTLVGREGWNDLQLSDTSVSGVHCVFVRQDHKTYVLDANSLNGTRVNHQSIQATLLRPGDRIQLGGTQFYAKAPEDKRRAGALAPLESPQMKEVYRLTARVAPACLPVFIRGETGVGKESVASAIHQRSRRPGKLVTINAATLRPDLAASTLFGHKKGAFTGATQDVDGAFKAADRGTLFLDEVAELPLKVQAQLLRVLECWEIRPVGSNQCFSVDVRLISATHKDLANSVRAGAFREDLFHRLCVLPLGVPPLRERLGDIPTLANHFLKSQNPPRLLSSSALRKILGHSWPGNVRELNNTLSRACVLSQSPILEPGDIQFLSVGLSSQPFEQQLRDTIAWTFEQKGRSVSVTAKTLGIHPSTVARCMDVASKRKP